MVIREDVLNITFKKTLLSREESQVTCQRKSPFEGLFS